MFILKYHKNCKAKIFTWINRSHSEHLKVYKLFFTSKKISAIKDTALFFSISHIWKINKCNKSYFQRTPERLTHRLRWFVALVLVILRNKATWVSLTEWLPKVFLGLVGWLKKSNRKKNMLFLYKIHLFCIIAIK